MSRAATDAQAWFDECYPHLKGHAHITTVGVDTAGNGSYTQYTLMEHCVKIDAEGNKHPTMVPLGHATSIGALERLINEHSDRFTRKRRKEGPRVLTMPSALSRKNRSLDL